jgi:hypothetical protein
MLIINNNNNPNGINSCKYSVCTDNCSFSNPSLYSKYQRCAGQVGVDNCIKKMCQSDTFKQLKGNYEQCQTSCKVHCNPSIPLPPNPW